ncbi:hypothetical protein DMB66_27725 [Actinoplanes sp. ATCC 53533]|uniref:hypothetical protein n=1 Tax=Actinoplanes sp. ATCC 53533 TaxID=1288362 RepID=UPI000F76EA3F|nr:hypothetical protein [Actinoplanes sp. ATCC 53533]RSM59477.1 hypothetical protein DMB66_27725 [Actinoplanes sp. ATCC 53533]
MTTTITGAQIPAEEHATGFVAVAIRFPTDPTAHRATSIYHRPDGTDGGLPVRLTEKLAGWTEVRPSCRPDTDSSDRLYQLSIPTALARGAVACDQPECFGGPA